MKDKELKPTANIVGVAPLGDPHFEEHTQKRNPSKAYSNPNSKHKTLTSNVAITLIALVITIIVMLILVGVSVSIAINGGLFSTAKKAVTKTEEAKDSELRFMAMANAATHNEKWEYEVEGQKIPIPAGFAPTEIEGEDSLEEGLVITDAEGNEFVWIPCTTKDAYDNATFKSNSDWSNYQYDYTGKEWTDGEEKVGEKAVKEIKRESIEDNHGFYVARYEAGIPENADFYADSEGDTYYLYKKNVVENENNEKYKPVSKKGYPAWNFISQTNAKTVSENMYKNNTTVNSYLIDSHAWNYICKNILKEKAKKNITDSYDWGNYVNNTKTKYENLDVLYAVHELQYNPWGWKKYAEGEDKSGKNAKYHKGSIPEDVMKERTGTGISKVIELATGASEDFMGYNIYDMAGNMWEWTTETGKKSDESDSTTTYAAFRGGGFSHQGSGHSVVFACGNGYVSDCIAHIGFRVVLYL